MPQGVYPVAAGYGREMTERKQVEVYSGQVVWVGELYFRQPQKDGLNDAYLGVAQINTSLGSRL